jgi:hypothetical protein
MKVRRKHILNLVNEILATNNIQTAPVNINKIAKNLDIQIIKQRVR